MKKTFLMVAMTIVFSSTAMAQTGREIAQDCLIAVKVEYYDKMGKLHRRLELSNITKVEGFWMAKKLHMTNVQTGHQTILEFMNPKYNLPMDESKFNVTTLEKGRF